MPILKMLPDEIRILRKTLKMSEGEFAERLELEDRQVIKLLEAGTLKPTVAVNKLLFKLLGQGSARSPKLKKMLDEIKERSQTRW